uniref:Uncharacterized protein n=1 Tax=Acrobeloides nanus TaxID=290746 RepID=A0A914DIS5_9BILA
MPIETANTITTASSIHQEEDAKSRIDVNQCTSKKDRFMRKNRHRVDAYYLILEKLPTSDLPIKTTNPILTASTIHHEEATKIPVNIKQFSSKNFMFKKKK